MKFLTAVCMVGIGLFAAGCAEERIPSDEADAWEIPVENDAAPVTDAAKPPASAGDDTKPEAPETLPADVVAKVKGSAFSFEGTSATLESSGDSFTVGHYFMASAPVDLKTSVTMIESDLEGRNVNGSVPLITIQLTSTSGKYRSFSKEPRPIDGKQILKDSYDIGPGTYKVSLSYYKDTVGEIRPAITLNSVTFRNLPASDNTTTAPQ